MFLSIYFTTAIIIKLFCVNLYMILTGNYNRDFCTFFCPTQFNLKRDINNQIELDKDARGFTAYGVHFSVEVQGDELQVRVRAPKGDEEIFREYVRNAFLEDFGDTREAKALLERQQVYGTCLGKIGIIEENKEYVFRARFNTFDLQKRFFSFSNFFVKPFILPYFSMRN